MYAIEFETEITNKYIELQDYEKLINKHAKVIVLVKDPVIDTSQADKIEYFKTLINTRKNLPPVENKVDIIKLCNEADSDIF
ncbi:hypothetical protein [Methylomonas sp. CM2]|uniref:hypothetical protein n=1 Tax=Methylomonas sp. CM2 TaxID=3417647 RepID=UPI003CF88099